MTLRVLSLWAPVAVYMAAIFGLSSISQPPGLPGGPSDKLIHAAVYAGLAVVIARALAGGWGQPIAARTAWLAAALATLYGITDEVHQRFVPFRSAEAADLVADAAGAAAAAVVLYVRDIIRGRHGL